jgi:hypothetical protein
LGQTLVKILVPKGGVQSELKKTNFGKLPNTIQNFFLKTELKISGTIIYLLINVTAQFLFNVRKRVSLTQTM